jgi:hypothetical protein
MQIPDHPVIRNLELTGYPDGQEPSYPICPICHEEADTFYVDPDEQIIGCDNCIKTRDAWGMTVDQRYE